MNLDIIKDIPRYKEWTNITVPLNGWSEHLKYKVQDISGNDYVLRVSDISFWNTKKEEYDNIMRLSQYDILMPKPVEFGLCNSGKHVYMLLTWIDGVAVEDVLSSLDPKLQYQIGYSSGKLLRKIHTCSHTVPEINWGTLYRKNIDMIIDDYHKVNLSINYEQQIIDYIGDNKHLLNNRSQVIRHGDFHVGNLIITQENKVGVIDFDKCAVGDSWEEFGGIVWGARLSEQFAKGQIDGYFSDDVPDEFFRLLALYIGIYALEHVVRSARNNTDSSTRKSIYANTDFMSRIFDNFTTFIPSWYR